MLMLLMLPTLRQQSDAAISTPVVACRCATHIVHSCICVRTPALCKHTPYALSELSNPRVPHDHPAYPLHSNQLWTCGAHAALLCSCACAMHCHSLTPRASLQRASLACALPGSHLALLFLQQQHVSTCDCHGACCKRADPVQHAAMCEQLRNHGTMCSSSPGCKLHCMQQHVR
jgi:hypothetical protein